MIIAIDGSNIAKFLKIDTDDAAVAKGQEAQLVICLNYVFDAATDKWIPMTQP
jgi:hypothetical protein